MKIFPIVSKDILGRYIQKGNTIIDHFTNQVVLKRQTPLQAQALLQEVNRKGLLNSEIIDYNFLHPQHKRKLYYVA